MDPATLTIALAGIAATLIAALAGPLAQTRAAAQHEERARLHADRVRLYTDAMIHAHNSDEYLDWLTGEVLHRPTPSAGLPGQDQITGRMWLLAPGPVMGPWLSLLAAHREIAYNLTEEWDNAPGYGRPMPARTEPSVAQALKAITDLQVAMRTAVETPTSPRRGPRRLTRRP